MPSTNAPEDSPEEKLRREIAISLRGLQGKKTDSREYTTFREQYLPRHLSLYEKFCQSAETLGVKPTAQEAEKLAKAIETCHLGVTPTSAYSLALAAPLIIIFLGMLFSIGIPLALGANQSVFFFLLSVFTAIAVYFWLSKLPYSLAEDWRMRASNQMVLCLFYITTYMRHTSNLENAIGFASEHVGSPLSLDLRKVMWDVQTERFSSVQQSLDYYLMGWKDTNLEFVEAMNLVQSSLFETSQERRLSTLEKSMNLMLDETYEKMLHYAQNLKSPMTMLHMLGIILPILGLVILPLAVSFLPEVKWYHLFALYNIILPLGVFMLGKSILAKRPSGYGDSDLIDINPELKKLTTHTMNIGGQEIEMSPAMESFAIAAVLIFIGLLPIILHLAAPGFKDINIGAFSLLGYVEDPVSLQIVGPYGLGAAVLSLFLTLGVGLGLSHYYSVKSDRVIKIRDETKALEQEFAGAIFQLGNRIGDGIPAEIAFAKVSETLTGTRSGRFFEAVAVNIQKMGFSVEQAIFDSKRGAILAYPSPIIQSAMKVLVESARKGPQEASLSLITMSNYIKEMHRVEERLKDLMADIISGMRSQITFLTPAIAGIVVGITSMITTILGSLQTQIGALNDTSTGASSSFANFLGLGIPTYYFQFIVGFYVIQITWILAYLVNGIENGVDKLNEQHEQARGLRTGVVLYLFISLVVIILFNVIAGSVLGNLSP